jgi:hypothetical protein
MTTFWRSLPARLFIAIVIGGLFVARLPGPEAALAASDESTSTIGNAAERDWEVKP